MRQFESGATRDTDVNKPDYEGFLSPQVLRRYAEYMNKNRVQADGNVRDSDNWQKGIPREVYMKSMFRHFMDTWEGHRSLLAREKRGQTIEHIQDDVLGGGTVQMEDNLCALLFNVMGYLFELENGR